jgi:hypothetical protein
LCLGKHCHELVNTLVVLELSNIYENGVRIGGGSASSISSENPEMEGVMCDVTKASKHQNVYKR